MAKGRKTIPAGSTVLELLGDEASSAADKARAGYRSLPDGFIRWCEDKTCVLDKETNCWLPWRFTDWQLVEVKNVFTGEWLTIVLSWPRRHGKSEVSARYDLWRADNFDFQLILIGSNSEDQSLSTAFAIAEATVRNSPELAKALAAGEIEITSDEIRFHKTHSIIRGITSSERSNYGKKVNVGHMTELCKAPDDTLWQVIASSTGDAHQGVALADSNVGSDDNIVWKLIQLGRNGEDPTIGVSYVSYRDVEDAVRRGPKWITEPWLRSRERQMTPGEFRRNHLNLPATAGEKLFTEKQVTSCIIPELPLVHTSATFRELRRRYYAGAVYRGGGLDRSLSFSKSGDRTIWAVVTKGLLPDHLAEVEVPIYDETGNLVDSMIADPWEYTVVELKEIAYSDPTQIKQDIEGARRRFEGLDNIAFEQYQASDLNFGVQADGNASELSHATAPLQLQMFNELYRVIASGRFRTPNHPLLIAELSNMEEDSSGRLPSFRGPKVRKEVAGKLIRIKDDTVYAVGWAIWALRECSSIPSGPPFSVPGERSRS